MFTPVTYLSKLPGIHTLAALLQLELFRVYEDDNSTHRTPLARGESGDKTIATSTPFPCGETFYKSGERFQ
ncbi:hypothetical protein PZBJ_04245 [Pantoea endophytica]|uniref:Uncharacterized protein n=1 Tax=Pantoea endophytica TaxID=92488 RepID=A0ABX4SUC1_9GAMM|nr:hypothetical protein PZBJ_04245 [Pantoea endophytica]